MRIFVASGIFHPDSGGPATYLYRLLPELQARGHAVRVLAYGNALLTGYPYPLTRIPIDRLPVRLIKYARAYRAGAAWADLIYLNSLGLPRSGDGRKPRVMKIVGDYAWESGVRRGWIPAAEDVDVFQTRRYGPLVEWAKASRRRETLSMNRVIVPSEYLRRMVVGWGAHPDRVQVIYNALDTQGCDPGLSRAEARDQLGWPRGGRYLVTAARLTAWKGIDALIDALARVPGITLVVAGDGPQYAALRSRAADRRLADRVNFLGAVPHERVALYLRAADYLVLYSGYEGLSHTILEALYAGTPVIASARGGNPEIVRDGENGLLVRHPDLDALVMALGQAFEGDMPQRLAAGARSGLERFAWPTLVEQTVRALSEVAACTS
jgi:glycosyltransferase involved in cell wall biosynthesis